MAIPKSYNSKTAIKLFKIGIRKERKRIFGKRRKKMTLAERRLRRAMREAFGQPTVAEFRRLGVLPPTERQLAKSFPPRKKSK